MNSSAEQVAKIAADLKAGRVHNQFQFDRSSLQRHIMQTAVTVDSTQVYKDLVKRDTGVFVYEDHVLRPVWEQAFICYLNEHGNVMAMHTHSIDLQEKPHDPKLYWESQSGTHEIEWSRVRWMYHVFVYIGGHSGDGRALPTSGPVHMWRIAVYPNGEIADINWIHIAEKYPMEYWDMAQLVVLGTINLGNCVNVEIVEPQRPRAERRRIERTGVRVSELHLRPISKSYRGKGQPGETGLVPMHSVRGHFASYGPDYDRKLLFGKYAGRYWIPAHARGNPDVGETDQRYTVDVAKETESFVE